MGYVTVPPIVREADFPHGLRCGECLTELAEGDRYAERWTGMIGDGIQAVMLICAGCATVSELIG